MVLLCVRQWAFGSVSAQLFGIDKTVDSKKTERIKYACIQHICPNTQNRQCAKTHLCMMTIIAVTNQKGGVGKTTIAFNLSQILATCHGKKVLAVDNDPQANLTSSFKQGPAESNIRDAYDEKPLAPETVSKTLSFIGSDITLASVAERDFQAVFKLKEALDKIRSDYDHIIIDCLPSFGHLHLSALNAADYVLIPVKPAPYALAGIKELFETIAKAKKYFNADLKILGIVINQSDSRRLIMECEMEKALREAYGNLVFKTKINKRVRIEESPAFQQSITEYRPKEPAAAEFRAFTKEFLQRLQRPEFELPSFKEK
jgi:chromosome partitioning protein